MIINSWVGVVETVGCGSLYSTACQMLFVMFLELPSGSPVKQEVKVTVDNPNVKKKYVLL